MQLCQDARLAAPTIRSNTLLRPRTLLFQASFRLASKHHQTPPLSRITDIIRHMQLFRPAATRPRKHIGRNSPTEQTDNCSTIPDYSRTAFLPQMRTNTQLFQESSPTADTTTTIRRATNAGSFSDNVQSALYSWDSLTFCLPNTQERSLQSQHEQKANHYTNTTPGQLSPTTTTGRSETLRDSFQ